MPFIRGSYLNHPQTGEDGFWVELSTDPPGTLTGMAKTAWPVVDGADTLATYAAKMNAAYRTLCNRLVTSSNCQVVVPVFKFISLSPLALDPDEGAAVTEGDLTVFSVQPLRPGVAMGVMGLTYSQEMT